MRTYLLVAALVTSAAIWGLAQVSVQVRIPRLEFRDRTLTNGLRVISLQEHTSPTVAIQVWYRVGSKDDPPGRSGFAHLFEHMMFKGTRNMKDEMMDRLTEDVGGINNASTGDDSTDYYEVVPSNYLEPLLWAEAERMSSLNVNEANFRSERDVVKEEFRQRILAPPYGKLFYLLEQKSFARHPYRRPGIGSIEELESASLQDVRKFHATFYRPDNAVLVVAGDFEPKQLDAWVDKYFAGTPQPSEPIPRVSEKEPPRTAGKRYIEYSPNVPLPAVAMTFLVPPVTDRDAPVLTVAEALLSAGESSRLYQALVYRQQLAQEAFANSDLRQDAGLFIVGAVLAGGKDPGAAERSLTAELDQLKTRPVSVAELDKAKNQLVTDELRQRQTNNGKAEALARAAVLLGDVNRVNTEIEQLQAVSAADVQRVAQKYFVATNRVLVEYLPESMKQKPATGATKGVGR